jgi:hypothetical protein
MIRIVISQAFSFQPFLLQRMCGSAPQATCPGCHLAASRKKNGLPNYRQAIDFIE